MPDEAELVLLALLSHRVAGEEKRLLLNKERGLMLAKVLPRAS